MVSCVLHPDKPGYLLFLNNRVILDPLGLGNDPGIEGLALGCHCTRPWRRFQHADRLAARSGGFG